MRAIIIDDKDALALLDSLKLEYFKSFEKDPSQMDTIREIHRKFHYVVCVWLQDQGCKVTR